MNEQNKSLRTIFNEAAELADAARRAEYLQRACGTDADLRRKLEDLLSAHSDAGGFLGDGGATTVLAPTPITERAGDRIGRYKLLQQIGEGGCGVVYMAEQEEPIRRRVALKVIKLGMDTKSVIARFEAERQALALMDHPNIAKVFDGGATDAGRPFFVMELVRGVRITDYCDEAKLSTRERLDLFIKVCQAIQHAHQKGIIHRDIKPSNILVTVNDGVAVPKVIDFGIAKATEARLTDKTLFTQFEALIGTPAYMSPEQAVMTSLDIDTRSDIYSLGVLLYEMLTGKTPFDAKELLASGIDEMRRTIREQEPVRPSTRLSTMLEGELTTTAKHRQSEALKLINLLRGDVDWIVMKCLEKDRARRYDTANGLASDIQRHLNNEAVLARPPSAAYRFQKLVRRNKLAFAAATAVAAALVIGLGAATVMFFRERMARKGEQQQRVEAQSAQKVAETAQQHADTQARKTSESQEQSRRLLYASDMNLAQQSLKLNNLGRARRLLERHRPQPGAEDLRGWEWRYLWQLTRSSALVTLTNRPTRGFNVSFSPDGSRLAVGWWDGHVDLWDTPGRRFVRSLTDREYLHKGRVAFSPIRNLLAATSEPKVVSLYDLDSGRESTLWRAPDQGEWHVRDLAFSQDGSKVVIYAGSPPNYIVRLTPELGAAVWVVNVSSATIESRHATFGSYSHEEGGARLSPDNRRLYLARSEFPNYRYSIQCVDLSTGRELWQTEPQRDQGLTALDISPDGRVLASGSGFEDPTIHVWEAATGRLLVRLDGHTGWVSDLTFTRDGRRLVSAASDQSIRFWDTNTWAETRVLHGHTDEVHAIAISERAQLVASAGKDGNLMLWKEDGKSVMDGYSRLPENLLLDEVLPLDRSRVLLLPPGKPPELVDLKRDSPSVSLPQIGTSTDVLGWFGTNILCHWNGTNQILVRELRGAEFIQRGAITLTSGTRPSGFAYSVTRQFLAWSEGTSLASVYLASLEVPGRRIELTSDVPGLSPYRFSEDGNHLAARTKGKEMMRVWNIASGQIVTSIGERVDHAVFAAAGQVLVAEIWLGNDHEIRFYDLTHPDRSPRRVPGKEMSVSLAVSPDGRLVASSTLGALVRLFDPTKGEWIEDLRGHLNNADCVAFSPDGRRLISSSIGREAVKLWDIGTRQELLTLSGAGSGLDAASWSNDGDMILAGAPWQAWRAPSWEEIAAAEAKEKMENKQP
ncbi:MAG: protein kinase [Verrucomicrobia bacterium]|nr:protein kinase [Verrucomicrobiota bacterium]